MLSFFLSLVAASSAFDAVQKHFASHLGFEVQFEQKITDSLFPEQTDHATGTIKYEKPQHLVWSYLKPQKKVIEYFGSQLTVDDGRTKEEVASPADLNLRESFSFLWGATKSSIFAITPVDTQHFEVVPKKKKSASFRKISVTVKEGFVTMARITNTLGGESLLEFKNWKLK